MTDFSDGEKKPADTYFTTGAELPTNPFELAYFTALSASSQEPRLSWGARYLMVPPTHFTVDYSINPYMDPSVPVDSTLALHQWNNLKRAIEQAGGTVAVLSDPPKELPDMTYAMNLGYAMGGSDPARKVLISRMRHEERMGESALAKSWFKARGFKTETVAKAHLEAGDLFPWNGKILAGTGPRTAVATLSQLKKFTGRQIVSLPSISSKAYHLDLSFCPLTEESALVYPGAFSEETLANLLAEIPKPFLLEEDEALEQFAANSIVVKNTAIMPAQVSRRVQKWVEALGLKVKLVDVSELEKGGGSIRCLTNPLDFPLP